MAVAEPERIFRSGGGPMAPASVDDLASIVRDARPGTSFRVRGSGTWLDAARPVTATTVLDLGALSGIVEHVPGDLTLTALAGTPLAALDAAVRPHGQWLPLDPFGRRDGTLGATLATSSCGPLAATIGHPRDLTLGIEVVDGAGRRQRAGGRVVKNVAGFDLVRLHVGAWGSLGVITEATVRLRALPDADRTIILRLPRSASELHTFISEVRALPMAPLAAELLSPALATRLALPAAGTAALRFTGSNAAVTAATDRCLQRWQGEEVDPVVWDRLALFEPAGAHVIRYAVAPASLAGLWHQARTALDSGLMHATMDRGVLRIATPTGFDANVDDVASAHRASRIVERGRADPEAPAIARIARIARDLRRAFDPNGRLNPGILSHDVD